MTVVSDFSINREKWFEFLKFEPHKGQDNLFDSSARFKVWVCGRRWGKSLSAARWAETKILIPGTRGWVVSSTYDLTRKVIREIYTDLVVKLMKPAGLQLIRDVQTGPIILEFPWGSTVEGKSADQPNCYDEDTEILTDHGWQFFRLLSRTDRVMTLNPQTRACEWQFPTGYVSDYYDGPMIHFVNRSTDLLVTPNHRFFVEGVGGKSFIKADEILSNRSALRIRIPNLSTGFEGEDNPHISEDMCALLGFYLAEGTAYGNCGGDIKRTKGNYFVNFAQKPGKKGGLKGDVYEKFRLVLDRLGYTYSAYEDRIVIRNKELWQRLLPLGNKYTKYIPKEYKELPRYKLRVLLDWLILGDGSVRKRANNYSLRRVYFTVSKQLADDVMEIAVKCGYGASIKVREQSEPVYFGTHTAYPAAPLYVVTIRTSKYKYFCNSKGTFLKDCQYAGNVYCVSVPNQIVLVRRNGQMCWSGNSLIGEGLDWLVFDECAKSKLKIWEYYLRPTLSDRSGQALFITTPNGYNWVYDLWKRGKDPDFPEWESHSSPSWKNPYLNPDDIEEAKRTLSDAAFRQEYGAEFTIYAGQVYKEFDEDVHVIPENELWIDSMWPRFRAIDFGYENPFVCLYIAVDDQDRIIVYDEYYVRHVTLERHAKHLAEDKTDYVYNICDVSGASARATLLENGIPTVAARSSVEHGLEAVRGVLRTRDDGTPGFYISSKCVKTIEEFNLYSYPDVDTKISEEPIKEHDHACLVAGTLVDTIVGKKPIEDVSKGDSVLTRMGYRRVVSSGCTGVRDVVKVKFSNGAILVGTPDHPVATEAGWVSIGELQLGDVVQNSQRTNMLRPELARVVAVENCEVRREVYNLEIEGEHEFFANGILTHNCDALRYFVVNWKRGYTTQRVGVYA